MKTPVPVPGPVVPQTDFGGCHEYDDGSWKRSGGTAPLCQRAGRYPPAHGICSSLTARRSRSERVPCCVRCKTFRIDVRLAIRSLAAGRHRRPMERSKSAQPAPSQVYLGLNYNCVNGAPVCVLNTYGCFRRSRSLNDDPTFQENRCRAREDHPVAVYLASHGSPSSGYLTASQVGLAQSLRPIGRQAAMGDSGNRVLWNSVCWSEEA